VGDLTDLVALLDRGLVMLTRDLAAAIGDLMAAELEQASRMK
jgi:hypothetical protein